MHDVTYDISSKLSIYLKSKNYEWRGNATPKPKPIVPLCPKNSLRSLASFSLVQNYNFCNLYVPLYFPNFPLPQSRAPPWVTSLPAADKVRRLNLSFSLARLFYSPGAKGNFYVGLCKLNIGIWNFQRCFIHS